MELIPIGVQEQSVQAENVRQCGEKRLKGILDKGSEDQPLVTVVTAVYNRQPYVAGCLWHWG